MFVLGAVLLEQPCAGTYRVLVVSMNEPAGNPPTRYDPEDRSGTSVLALLDTLSIQFSDIGAIAVI